MVSIYWRAEWGGIYDLHVILAAEWRERDGETSPTTGGASEVRGVNSIQVRYTRVSTTYAIFAMPIVRSLFD